MASWEMNLQALGLRVPDDARVRRARNDVLPTVQASGKGEHTCTFVANLRHTVSLVKEGTLCARCTCQDFSVRQAQFGLACKHIVAVAMWLEDAGMDPATLVDALPDGAPGGLNAWPVNALRAAVGKAIQRLADRLGAYLMGDESPLMIGPTGSGKTGATHMVAQQMELGLEEAVGSDSWTEADLIGCWTPAREWAWGPVGRAFKRAREGEQVIVFVDEITRFNPRAMDLLLRALQPLEASLARRMGVSIPEAVDAVYLIEAPLLGHRDWAPSDRVSWVAAGNPGVNPLDPALVRRFLVLEATLDRGVLDALPPETGPQVAQLWDSYERGELPLPLEYQQLLRARSPDELFTAYHARLRALDPIAAEALARILAGNGVAWGGAQ